MPTKPKLYLDSCCFIEMAKYDANAIELMPHDDVWFCKKLLEASRNGDIQVFTSLLTMNECLFIRDGKGREVFTDEVKRLFSGMLTSGKSGVIPVQPNIFVTERARDLIWIHRLNVKPMDSLHLASALEMGCSEFITTDEGIHTQSLRLNDQGLAVIYAKETSLLPAEYRQLSMTQPAQ